MARYNKAFGISFNDNDGGASWWSDPELYSDYERHVKCLGTIRARIFFLKKLWRCMRQIEGYGKIEKVWLPRKQHKFKV